MIGLMTSPLVGTGAFDVERARRDTPGAAAAQDVQGQLSRAGVNVSVSLVDYARLDLPSRGLPDLVCASVHYYNTDTELQQLIDALPAPGGSEHPK